MGFGDGRILMTKLVLDFAEGAKICFPYYSRYNLPLAHSIAVTEPVLRQFTLALLTGKAITSPQIHLSVAKETNQKLTAAQRELLLEHYMYGHAYLYWIQNYSEGKYVLHLSWRHRLKNSVQCAEDTRWIRPLS